MEEKLTQEQRTAWLAFEVPDIEARAFKALASLKGYRYQEILHEYVRDLLREANLPVEVRE